MKNSRQDDAKKAEISPRHETDAWQSIGAIAARLVEKAKQERGK